MLRLSSDTLQVGNSAPAFSLPMIDRKMISLDQFRGQVVVVVFIRGTW